MNSEKIWGLLITLAIFAFFSHYQEKSTWRHKSIFLNPILLSSLLLGIILMLMSEMIEGQSPESIVASYRQGADLLSFALGPITVALAIPLYQHISILKKFFLPITVGIVTGVLVSLSSIILLGKLTGLSLTHHSMFVSTLPKSISMPFGLEAAVEMSNLGADPGMTGVLILLTGIWGALTGPFLLTLCGIKHPLAVGLSMGTSAHAVGTARAFEIGNREGAMSGLALGLTGTLTVLILGFLNGRGLL
jgi:putative effector of murein hydrolase